MGNQTERSVILPFPAVVTTLLTVDVVGCEVFNYPGHSQALVSLKAKRLRGGGCPPAIKITNYNDTTENNTYWTKQIH